MQYETTNLVGLYVEDLWWFAYVIVARSFGP